MSSRGLCEGSNLEKGIRESIFEALSGSARISPDDLWDALCECGIARPTQKEKEVFTKVLSELIVRDEVLERIVVWGKTLETEVRLPF